MNNALTIENFAQTSYRKCDCCKRVRDIYFRLNIRDAESASMLIGSIELCELCGKNFGEIINKRVSTERTKTEFKFE